MISSLPHAVGISGESFEELIVYVEIAGDVVLAPVIFC